MALSRPIFSYNPQKYIHKQFLLSNPRKSPPSKLICYTVEDFCLVNGVCPDGNILQWQSKSIVRGMAAGSYSTLWSHLH